MSGLDPHEVAVNAETAGGIAERLLELLNDEASAHGRDPLLASILAAALGSAIHELDTAMPGFAELVISGIRHATKRGTQ